MKRVDPDQLLLSPSDLLGFLACRHRTALDLARARGELELRRVPRPDAELVAERGRLHEAAHLAALRADGREVVAIEGTGAAAAGATEAAMRAGAEVIYQAAFLDAEAGWQGYADFLVRVPEASDLGPWSYEAHDTKLARHPKPYFILQLALYSELVAGVQGRMPERMHVVLGSRELVAYRYADFAAYVRRVRDAFRAHLAAGAPAPYPYPVDHCAHCDWWLRCAGRRREDDHLSLVASLSRSQALRLEAGGVRTVAALAALDPEVAVPRVAPPTLAGLRQQARLQVHTRTTGEPVRELLAPEPGRGLARLPRASPGDVFFDIEGDPYWGEEGLEYLFGAVTTDGAYHAWWAHDLEEERAAFEGWVDWVTARLAAHPGAHVYHYNHYEPTALKRLMSRYGTREAEVDALLRREAFVDLYTVVRQGLRVGQPSYSLKELEAFYPLERDAEITEAGGSILAYQRYLESGDRARLAAIAAYNADDCRSTAALSAWLREQRAEVEQTFGRALEPVAPVVERERSPEVAARLAELEALREGVRAGARPGGPQELLADLLDYHHREAKPAWWAYFDRLGRTPRELCEDDTEAIGQLTPATDASRREEARSVLIPLRFPPQQHKLGPGSAVDPETGAGVSVTAVEDERGLVWIKRGKGRADAPLPRALVPGGPLAEEAQQGALRRLAARVLARGDAPGGELDVACALLARRAPRVLDAAALDGEVLVVQGPPGAGKTWTGARLVVAALARGERVGVAATTHKAIHLLLAEVEDVAAAAGVAAQGLKKATAGRPETAYESDGITSATASGAFEPVPEEVNLVAGTSWLFAREGLAAAVDLLVVDEAGQVALADAVAMAQAARRGLVLLGDPQQLAHVSQGTHPRGSGRSVLEHALDGAPTVPPDRGRFLARTHRLHPEIAAFVSEAMYEGRLESEPGCAARRILIPTHSARLGGAGLRFLGVEHAGNRQQAREEAVAIARAVETLLAGGELVGPEGARRPLALADVLVVAPYNAQVRCLRAHLPPGARVGTVDKFQGQEAPVVFFSMASSSGEDVPRGLEFLFSRNRLNVAVSRAQCLAVVACAPALLTTTCQTVEQMRLVNALCRFAELATPVP